MYLADFLLCFGAVRLIVAPCTSNRSPTAIRPPPSSCARAIAKAGRSGSARCSTCPTGPASGSPASRRCSRDELGLGMVDEEELYAALDWLAVRQPAIEAMLAKRHLSGGTLVLYDVTSSYMEGRCCPLARFGYNRDGKKGKLQIVYGLLCAPDGCPVAVEVFEGSTG